MKKFLCASSVLVLQLLCAASSASASDLEGTLTVKEKVTLKGTLGRKKSFDPGTYNAKIDVHNVLKRVTLGLAGRSYRFHFPKGLQIPMLDGQTNLEAGANGQDLSLKWNVATETKIGPRYTQMESCVYDTYYTTDCYWNAALRRRVCDQVPHNVYGTQEVTRHNEKSDHFFTLDFTNEQGASAATLKATTTNTKNFVDFMGVCLR